MRLDAVSQGENPPYDINVVIEVPLGGEPVKYELDKASGALMVDRILHTSMRYPCNYGFMPHTLSDDGDPIDVMVVSRIPVVPGAIIRCRPIGVLVMEDEAGEDEKIIAVPVNKLSPYYKDVSSYRELPDILIDQIAHFFGHYKDLEDKKWVQIKRWGEPEEAMEFIRESIHRHTDEKAKK
ncbi:MAG: inorganic diphosphatase [Hyphomicrobiales bacterium]|nr:MAG: inorganic diphosphatase [Hyphomicrobiales bacterium]